MGSSSPVNGGGGRIHFKMLEDPALEMIGDTVRLPPEKACIENQVKILASTGQEPVRKKLKVDKVKEKTAKKVIKKVAKKRAKG